MLLPWIIMSNIPVAKFYIIFVTLSSFLYDLLNVTIPLEINKTLHEYQFRVCRHFTFSRLFSLYWPLCVCRPVTYMKTTFDHNCLIIIAWPCMYVVKVKYIFCQENVDCILYTHIILTSSSGLLFRQHQYGYKSSWK